MPFSFDRNFLNPKSIGILGDLLQKVFADLEDSLTTTAGIQPDLGSGPPRSAVGDLLVSQVSGNITFKFVVSENSTINVTVGPAITNLNSFYLGQTSTNANPTTAEYPVEDNWGFHTNTSTGKIFLTINQAGSIKKIELT